jgi:hypothetical protein
VATSRIGSSPRAAGSAWAVPTALLGRPLLFGLLHTEQGLVGVLITFFDGLFFS